jgi:trimeric autotransporter adhesin
MTTQYTPILKLALPVQGELSGTWGDVVNDNITSMVEQAIAGLSVVNTWTTNSHVLTTANGTTAESRAAMLSLTDSGTALTGAGSVICPALSKVYIVKNGTAQVITVKTAAGSGIAVPVGKTMLVYCDGTNVLEAVDHVVTLSAGTLTITGLTTFASLKGTGAVTVTNILDEDNMASDSATALATQQSIKAYVDSQVGTVDTLSEILAIGNTSGANNLIIDNGQAITTNTINETTAASGVTIDSVLLKDDGVNATNLEITNLKANDGTSAGSIADSTGVVTLASSVLTTADINGGTIDNTVIGGTTAAAGSFTTGSFSETTFVGLTARPAGVPATAGRLWAAQDETGNYGIASKASTTDSFTYIGNTGTKATLGQSYGSTGSYLPLVLQTSDLDRLTISAAGAATFSSTVAGAFNGTLGATTPASVAATTLSTTGAATIEGLTVGKGAGAVATNTAVGASALAVNTSGATNTAIGESSLFSTTTGAGNTAVGYRTLYTNVSGTENTAQGYAALYYNTGNTNSAYGYQALFNNTTASNNTAVGFQAGYSNTTGAQSVFVGQSAGYTNTTGTQQVFVGLNAGYSTTGNYNTFVGAGSGYSVSTGAKNTILGSYNGNQGGLDIRTASNHIVLSDGDGNPRAYWDAAGAATFGGNVSVNGATSPNSSLAILADSGANAVEIRTRATSNDYAFINFNSTDGSEALGAIGVHRTAAATASLIFYSNDGTAGVNEVGRFDASGNLGVGAAATAGVVNANSTRVTIAGTNAASNGGEFIAGGAAAQISMASGTSKSYLWGSGAYPMSFGTNSTERMVLDASGNLGLGVVPSAWISVYKSIEFGIGAAVIGRTDDSSLSILTNLYRNSAGDYIYKNTGDLATLMTTESGGFSWNTAASGTAGGTASLSNIMTLDASGNLGIGVVPESIVHIKDSGNVSTTLQIEGAATGYAPVINFDGIVAGNADYLLGEINGSWDTHTNVVSAIRFESGADTTNKDDGLISFWTSSSGPTLEERARLTSDGNFLVGTTSATGSGASSGKQLIQFNGAAENALYVDDTRTAAGTDTAIIFGRGATITGSITTTLTTTAYVTSSDQRLKENITDADDAGDKIDAIQVRKFDWKVDGSHQDYGMVAQELQVVAPEAVSGDADSEEMMGVDYSKLVPMMLKEIQSLRARISQLEGAN